MLCHLNCFMSRNLVREFILIKVEFTFTFSINFAWNHKKKLRRNRPYSRRYYNSGIAKAINILLVRTFPRSTTVPFIGAICVNVSASYNINNIESYTQPSVTNYMPRCGLCMSAHENKYKLYN